MVVGKRMLSLHCKGWGHPDEKFQGTNMAPQKWGLCSLQFLRKMWHLQVEGERHLHLNDYMGVSKNNGTPKSSILIGFSIIFTIHFGVPLFLETSIY